MAASYQPFFSARVSHGFYGTGWPGLRWVASPDTARRLDRAGCVAGPSRETLDVYFDATRRATLEACLADPREPLVLTWRLQPAEWPADTITEGLPPDASQVLLLAPPAGGPDAQGLWPLHRGSEAGPAEWVKTRELQEPLAAGDALRPPVLVQLRLGREHLAAAPLQFTARLAARATVWKYFFLGRWQPDGLAVVDQERQAAFNEPRVETLADGRPALTVRSAAAIPLQQRPTRRFQLRRSEDGHDTVLIERLPAAAAGALAIDRADGQAGTVSEIYV